MRSDRQKRIEDNVLLICFTAAMYFIGAFLIDIGLDAKGMFNDFHAEADSFSFLDTGKALFNGTESPNIEIRPFLFSTIVYVLFSLGGVTMLYLYQAICLILANFFLFKSILKMTNSKYFAIAGSVVFALNFSLVHVSFLALTEPTVVLGLSILLFQVVRRIKQDIEAGEFWSFSILIFGCLTVVKPVFTIPFVLVVLLFIVLLIKRKFKFSRKILVKVGIGVSVVLFQMAIMKTNTGEFTISKIGSITLKKYLTAQVTSESMNITRPESLELLESYSESEVLDQLKENVTLSFKTYLKNVRQNVQSDPITMDYYHPEINKTISSFMLAYNQLLLYFFVLIVLFGAVYGISYKKSGFNPLIFLVLLLLVYLVLVTGIAYGQRDRLILPTTPIWIFLLSFAVNWSRGLLMDNKSR